jgi:hypothetical protein
MTQIAFRRATLRDVSVTQEMIDAAQDELARVCYGDGVHDLSDDRIKAALLAAFRLLPKSPRPDC